MTDLARTVTVEITLSPDDLADLRAERGALWNSMRILGEPESDEQRDQQARRRRRLALMAQIIAHAETVAGLPPSDSPAATLNDLDVTAAHGWIRALRGPAAGHRYNVHDRAKVAHILERLLTVALVTTRDSSGGAAR